MNLHWNEYLAEMLGTAILLFFGTISIILNFGSSSLLKQFIPDQTARHFLTGLMYAGTGSLVAISPCGRLSGGHINPAVSFSCWVLKKMQNKDFIGYVIFQFIGSAIGSLFAIVVWSTEFRAINGGLTLPGLGILSLEAFLAEILMTFILIISILIMLSHHRTTKLTPLLVWILVGTEVLLGYSISGTSLNPAKSFGPALVLNLWHNQWIYFTAPIIGALLATAAYSGRIFGTLELMTGKLFHTPSYRCIFLYCKERH
jgi:aquaporin Z